MKGSDAEAKAYALKLLSYRSRSRRELRDRLKRKGFGDEQINTAVLSLERIGLINDEQLAQQLLRYSTETKPLGKKGLDALLAKRGIDKELVSRTLSSHTKDTEEESAQLFVEKKLRSLKNYPADVVKRRLWGMLSRRGFSAGVIQKVVGSLRPA